MIVAYEGGEFHGFQKQPGQRTVQSVLTDAIRAIDPAASEPRGASRTDAGVHSRGQVVAFDSARELPPKGWRMQLNSALPNDVAVRRVAACEVGYEPRFDAIEKTYRYRIHVGESRDPLRDRYSWHVGPSLARSLDAPRRDLAEDYLDLDAMRDASRSFVGTHDFRAFRSSDDVRPSSIRTIRELRIESPLGDERDAIAITVIGNAFMKQMVRILVGTLVEVGRGKRAAASVESLLGPTARREDAGRTAPPHGLCLVEIVLGRRSLSRSDESA